MHSLQNAETLFNYTRLNIINLIKGFSNDSKQRIERNAAGKGLLTIKIWPTMLKTLQNASISTFYFSAVT